MAAVDVEEARQPFLKRNGDAGAGEGAVATAAAALPPRGSCSTVGGVANLVTTAVGAGMVALPRAVSGETLSCSRGLATELVLRQRMLSRALRRRGAWVVQRHLNLAAPLWLASTHKSRSPPTTAAHCCHPPDALPLGP